MGKNHSRSQQRTDQRVLVLTLKFLALKKTGFSPVKNTSKNVLDFFYLYSMQLFSAEATIFSKKILSLFFVHENIKKRASKIPHNPPQTFFSQVWPAAQTSQELILHIYVPRLICLLICGKNIKL
jgi:hypothetical protein